MKKDFQISKHSKLYKKFNLKQLLLLTQVLLFFISCGDLSKDNKKKEDSVSVDQALSCKLETERFSNIMREDITGPILCLQDQIHSFLDFVETDRPGFISEKYLIDFINFGPMNIEDAQDLTPIIEGIFDITKIFLGGDRGYISRSDFDRIINFLISFNKNIYPLYRIFDSEEEVNFAQYESDRNKVYKYLDIISKDLLNLYSKKRDELDRINTFTFLDRFFKDNLDLLEKTKSVMFIKRVFFGGNTDEMTHIELESLLKKLPELGQVAHDFVKLNHFTFSDSSEQMLHVYSQDLKTLLNNLYYDSSSYEALFTMTNVLDALDIFEVEVPEIQISKYKDEVLLAKKLLTGSSDDFVTSVDLIELFNHVDNILNMGEAFYKVYRLYGNELDQSRSISTDYSRHNIPENIASKELLKHFSRIANKYRFFKGAQAAPIYSHAYHRNASAFFEIGIIEYLVNLIFKEYGRPSERARAFNYHMTLEDTVEFMGDIKYILKDLGIITIGRKGGGEVNKAADNLVLMSTLFQFQSNGCNDKVCMETPEITEFLVGLLTALEVKDFFIETIESLCPESDIDQVGNVRVNRDEFGRINVECFRRNFIKALQRPIQNKVSPLSTERSLSDYMPLLTSYLSKLTEDISEEEDITSSRGYLKFITETEAFTRTCTTFSDGSDVPMKSTDAFAVFAGLLNVESTLIRFDRNKNNKLDGFGRSRKNEVLNAYYDVYEDAIKSLVAPNGGILKRFSKPIFQYIIKYGKVPDQRGFKNIWQFIRFLLRFNKGANASRTTIATILKTLGEESENSKKYPFKCDECLSNPNTECLPEDDIWTKL